MRSAFAPRDEGGLWFEKQFTIGVTDVNEAPTDLALSVSSLAENQPSGTTVGEFSSTDPDAGNTFSYSLVPGEGDLDNASFTIDASGNLKTAVFVQLTRRRAAYAIRVRTTDEGGLWLEKQFVIGVTDVNEAPVAVAGGSYSVGAGNSVQLDGSASRRP